MAGDQLGQADRAPRAAPIQDLDRDGRQLVLLGDELHGAGEDVPSAARICGRDEGDGADGEGGRGLSARSRRHSGQRQSTGYDPSATRSLRAPGETAHGPSPHAPLLAAAAAPAEVPAIFPNTAPDISPVPPG